MTVNLILLFINSMLLKNVLDRNETSETNTENKDSIVVNSTVKTIYKTIWKLKYV